MSVTIKDIKEFRGLSTKERTATAADIGRRFSEGTALGKIAMLALGAGLDAKANGDKTFTFDSTFNAFASEYFSNAKESTLSAYRSAFGNWTKAGMHTAFDASELAVRVFNESKYALTARSGMLKRLLKDKEPTAKEYAAAKPKTQNNPRATDIASATATLLRAVDAFGVGWLNKLPNEDKATFAQIRALADGLVNKHKAEEVVKPKADATKKATQPSFAEKRKLLLAQLATMAGKTGHKTIN